MLDFAAMKRDALARTLPPPRPARSASTPRPAGSTAPTPASTRSSRSASSSRGRRTTWSPPCRSPPRWTCRSRPAAAARLSGQSIGPGIVIDCRKYLNADPRHRPGGPGRPASSPASCSTSSTARVAGHGLQFGPDVATASRANLGGMIGNNSAGVALHRLRQDHRPRPPAAASSCPTAADGRVRPGRPAEWDRRAAAADAGGRHLPRACGQVVRGERRRDSPALPAHPAPRQRLQPRSICSRRPIRRTVGAADRRPAHS